MSQTFSRGDYFADLQTRIPNWSLHFTSLDAATFLDDAVREYSRYNPRDVRAGVRGAGIALYSLPASFDPGFSEIVSVEFPVGSNPPEFLHDDEWHLFEKGGNTLGPGTRIQLTQVTPGDGEYFVVAFTRQHSVDSSSTTIEDADFQGVSLLQAAYACEAAATRLSDSTDSTIVGDSVRHETQREAYESRASAYRKLAYQSLGLPLGEDGELANAPYGIDVDWDLKYQHGERFAWHRRR